jgi:dienelactone hydrolase
MATPELTRHTLPGALGDVLIDVRAGDRRTAGPAVIVLHGFKGFKDWGMFPQFADRLAKAGFTAVSLNVSGSGVDDQGEFAFPERFGHNTFSAELADLARVKRALVAGELGVPAPTSIGLVGHSRGGGMAILAVASDPGYRALVTWAAIAHVERWTETQRAEWRARGRIDIVNARTGQALPMYLDTLDDLERHARDSLDIGRAAAAVAIPWLLIHGEADEAVPVAEAEQLAERHGPAGLEVVRLPGAGHTFGAAHPWRGMSPDLEQVFDRSVGFFARHLA